MMKKPSPLAGKLVEYIETRIVSGEYRVGSRIPSVRRFGAKFGMSYGTVYRSIEHLCEVGVLERKGPDGIFVKSRRVLGSGGGGRIAVIMAPYVMEKERGLCHTAFMGIQDMALKYGYGLQISYIPTSNVNENIVREAVRGADGVILLNEYDHAMPEFPQLNIPAIGMLMQNSCNGRLALINIDPIDMAKTAVTYFMERRSYLRKVFIYSSGKPVYAVRGRLFKTFWEWGCGDRADIITEPPNEYTAYEEDCGYFFTSDQWAQTACETYMARTGELLTDRHLILGVDGKQLIDPDFFRFPTIATDWRRIGEVLIEEMVRMLREPNAFPRNINICGKLTIPAEAGDSLGC